MLIIKIIPVTAFQQNCSFVFCNETYEAALIDPGGDIDRLKETVKTAQQSYPLLKLTQILLTHAHLDHCAAARVIADDYGIPIIGPHHEDEFWLQRLPAHSEQYGMQHWGTFLPDTWLNDKDTVKIGNRTLQVIHCPGHTPGHVVFVDLIQRLAWVGDVIFSNSIGRTDFPKGVHSDLIHSIRHKLFPLGDDIEFICGHGENSTFGQQRLSNPHVADALFKHS